MLKLENIESGYNRQTLVLRGVSLEVPSGKIVALLGANVYLFLQLDKTKIEVAGLKDSMTREISGVKETSNVTTATSKRYISELKDEIARVEADIGRKQNHKSAADAFFRKPG